MLPEPIRALIDPLRRHWTHPDAERHFHAALTRRAWRDEHVAQGRLSEDEAPSEHEPYEWLGDRVLNLVVAARLWADAPGAAPGPLAKALDRLVSAGPLAEIAREHDLHLDGVLRVGAGERGNTQTTSDRVLSSHVEALIGAAWRAGGLPCATALVESLYAGRWPEPSTEGSLPGPLEPPPDAMSELNAWWQATRRGSIPKDAWTTLAAPDPSPAWAAEVSLPDGSGTFRATGWYPTVKEAKQATAQVVLEALRR